MYAGTRHLKMDPTATECATKQSDIDRAATSLEHIASRLREIVDHVDAIHGRLYGEREGEDSNGTVEEPMPFGAIGRLSAVADRLDSIVNRLNAAVNDINNVA